MIYLSLSRILLINLYTIFSANPPVFLCVPQIRTNFDYAIFQHHFSSLTLYAHFTTLESLKKLVSPNHIVSTFWALQLKSPQQTTGLQICSASEL